MRRALLGEARVLGACAAIALLAAAGAARAHEPAAPVIKPAEAPPEEDHEGYSPYESATIRRALAQLGATIDPAPEGKIVEAVEVIPLEVIEDRDPAPEFLNFFHATSRPYVIRRQVLLRVGEPYRQALADETARNLRALDPISLVLVFPVQGSRPDRVRFVTVTKDVWSIRLNSNWRIAGGQLEYFYLQPSELNLLGTHHMVYAQMVLDPGAIAFGAGYAMPHVGGSRIVLRTEANVIVGRHDGQPEGSFGSFSYGQPLYSTEAEWAWGAVIAWRKEVTRRFVGASVGAYDADATPEEDGIPYTYRTDNVAGSYELTRSFGGGTKHDFTVGVEASRKVYRTEDLSAYDPAAAAEFVDVAIPVSDTRVGPTFEYHTYSTEFVRVLDFNTLGLQEDYRLGHELSIRVYPVTKALRSTRDFVGVATSAAYTVPLGNGLARGVVETITEIEEDRIPDASIDVSARVHTPTFVVGRLVFDARLLNRYRNYLNRNTQIGGESRMRGYATGEFIGDDVLAANLEFRTRPLEILSCQLAGAAFFDMGDAFDRFEDMRIKQSAGFGVRILFPQLDRTVMRADWGFPLTQEYVEPDGFPGDIILTFRQAFPMPAPTE